MSLFWLQISPATDREPRRCRPAFSFNKNTPVTSPSSALTQLIQNPAYFLRWYQITIAGNPNASAVYDYWIEKVEGTHNERPGRTLGTLHMHSISTFQILCYDPGGDAHNFKAHSVQMVSEGSVAINAIQGYLLPDPSAHPIMVTGQLSGCSFACLSTANGVLTAHIQPNPNNAANLRTNLKNNGRFAGHPNSSIVVYGSHAGAGGPGYDHNSEYVSVIGVHCQGRWKIYAQVYMDRKVIRLDPIL